MKDSISVISIAQFQKRTGVHLTTKHTGKMTGLVSISTSCTTNPLCLQYAKNDKFVCAKCFSFRMSKYFTTMQEAFVKNGEILSTTLLQEFPDLSKWKYARIESFGDIFSEIQVQNYLNLVVANPTVKFAWWTKKSTYLESRF